MKRKNVARCAWLAVAAVCLLLMSTGWAQSTARIVRLSYISGEVQLDRGQGAGLDRAVMNMPVIQGTQIVTGNGEAEIEFEDGSTVRLAPNTEASFPVLALRGGATVSQVTITAGTAYFDYERHNDNDLSVQFGGNPTIDLRRSVRFRAEVDENSAQLAVFKGELDIYGVSNSVQVTKNETITLDLNDPEHYALANIIQPGPYDAWNNDRARYRTQYATARANGAYGFAYGELDNYGRYTYVPGYGNMWRPWNVGMSWSPFADGAWVYYPGYGYRWVSAYPWGWLPYNTGIWSWISGFGWAWHYDLWSPTTLWFNTTGLPVYSGPPGPGWQPPTPPAHPPIVAGVGGPLPPGSHPHPPIVVDGDPIGVKKGGHDNPGDGGGAPVGGAAIHSVTGGGGASSASGVVFVGNSEGVMTRPPVMEGGRGGGQPIRNWGGESANRFGKRGAAPSSGGYYGGQASRGGPPQSAPSYAPHNAGGGAYSGGGGAPSGGGGATYSRPSAPAPSVSAPAGGGGTSAPAGGGSAPSKTANPK